MRAFGSPPKSFAPLAVWIWNAPLEEAALRTQLNALSEAGFGGVVVRAADGVAPSYNSEAWLQQVQLVARACQSQNLAFWLTDEGPALTGTAPGNGAGTGRSGTGGGRITREHPELRSHFLRFHTIEVAREEATAWKFPAVAGQLLHAVVVPLQPTSRRPDFSRAITLTQEPLEHAGHHLARLNADVRVLIFAQERAGYVDLLNPQTSALFLESTHERLRLALGDEWASLTGFWLHAPTLRDKGETPENQRLPWSPLLMEAFEQQPGYELLEWLPALVSDLGDDASRLRQDFWGAVARIAREAFWQPISNYAEQHDKLYCGFIEGQEPLNIMVSRQSDAASVYRTLPRAGIEAPGLQNGGISLDLGRALHARLAASTASLKTNGSEGAARIMAEAWRGAGWGTTPGERLPSLHHLLRQGINGLAAHGAFATIGDGQLAIQPPSELHQPYAAQWKGFAQYIARTCYVLSHGRPGARIALLWPIRSAWAHHHPKGHRLTRWVEEDLYATALMLDDLHFEFLFVTEEDLQNGRFENGKVLCGAAQHAFELVVLPTVTTLHRATWSKLEGFLEAGGKVACLGLLPRYSERGRDVEFEEHISKTTMVTAGDIYEAYTEMENAGGQAPPTAGYPITKENEAGGRLSCYQPRLNESVKDALLRVRKILKESLTPELETQASNILYTRRILSRGESLEDADITRGLEGDESENDDVEKPLAPIQGEGFDWDQPFDWGEEFPPEPDDVSTADQSPLAAPDETPVEADAEDGGENNGLAGLKIEEFRGTDTAAREVDVSAGGDVFWIFNTGEEAQRVNLRLHPTQDGTPHLLDAWNGEIRRVAVWMQFPEDEDGGLSVALDMAPHEAKLLWIRPYASPAERDEPHVEASTWVVEDFDGRVARGYVTESGPPRIAVRRGKRLVRHVGEVPAIPAPLLLPDSWQAARIGPNTLAAPDWQWQRGRHLPGDQRWIFGRDSWQALPSRAGAAHSTLEASQGSSRVELSGIVTFRSHFEIAEIPQSLFMGWNPLGVPSDIYLNGELLAMCEPDFVDSPPWNDACWQWFDLSEWAQAGENILSCVADYREKPGIAADAPATRMPNVPRLAGDFDLTPDRAIIGAQSLVMAAGSWHGQGLPFFSGALDFKQWVKVPPEWQGMRIFLEIAHCRDVCGVWLNGRAAGVRYGAPHRFDVTKSILKGASNEVRLRVWNTAEAALEGHAREPQASGLLGPVRLVPYPIVHPLIESGRS